MFKQAFAGTTIPLQGTEIAARWDALYDFLVVLSTFFFILIVGGMIYFIFAYRYKPGAKSKYITGNHLLEAIWVAVPTLLLLMIFGWGYSIYHSMSQAPADAYEIRVIGKQWLWTFQYDSGRTTVGEVYVPINQPVKLIMTSEDVLHSFFVPNFRIKQDVVPGMYTSVWFTATVPGKHQVFCTEYCGTSHSEMLAKVIALDEKQWKAWLRDKPIGPIPDAGDTGVKQASAPPPNMKPVVQGLENGRDKGGKGKLVQQLTLAEQGAEVFRVKGCIACHSTDGTEKTGPTLKGVYNSEVELADGRKVIADEHFIQRHIELPQENTVKGYNPIMPTFQGLINAAEMNALIAYIKSLK